MTAQTAPAPVVKVGDFFVASWGYDQTNIDFYKVVGITPSGKSVKVQHWSSALVGPSGGPQESVVPGEGPSTWVDWHDVDLDADYWTQQEQKVVRDAAIVTRRLSLGGYKDAAISVGSGNSAFLWDGQPETKTGWGWGH